jgi:hypothetical protein
MYFNINVQLCQRITESRVLRSVFGPKGYEVIGSRKIVVKGKGLCPPWK